MPPTGIPRPLDIAAVLRRSSRPATKARAFKGPPIALVAASPGPPPALGTVQGSSGTASLAASVVPTPSRADLPLLPMPETKKGKNLGLRC